MYACETSHACPSHPAGLSQIERLSLSAVWSSPTQSHGDGDMGAKGARARTPIAPRHIARTTLAAADGGAHVYTK